MGRPPGHQSRKASASREALKRNLEFTSTPVKSCHALRASADPWKSTMCAESCKTVELAGSTIAMFLDHLANKNGLLSDVHGI